MRLFLPALIVVLVAVPPLLYKVRKHNDYRNLRTVDPGILYRSGQLTPAGLDRTWREKGIGTVISLRDDGDGSSKEIDRFEEKFCADRGIAYRRLDKPDWNMKDGVLPAEKTLAEFRAILDDPATPKPILVHCFAGEHRTGALVAVYRMDYDGWSNADAIEEMTSMGTARTTFDDTLLRYLGGYTPTRRKVGEGANRP